MMCCCMISPCQNKSRIRAFLNIITTRWTKVCLWVRQFVVEIAVWFTVMLVIMLVFAVAMAI